MSFSQSSPLIFGASHSSEVKNSCALIWATPPSASTQPSRFVGSRLRKASEIFFADSLTYAGSESSLCFVRYSDSRRFSPRSGFSAVSISMIRMPTFHQSAALP